MQSKVIAHKYLPTRLPLGTTALWWLVLDRFRAPQWAWGAFWAVAVIWWLLAVVAVCAQQPVKPSEIR